MATRSYRLETTDYLDGREVVTVKDRESGRLIWSKSRSLTEDEIVSTVFDSHHPPRFTLHRPRQCVLRSTSKLSPPWPQYLVIRSPSLPEDQYIPLIDIDQSLSKDTESNTLQFQLSIPIDRQVTKSPPPPPLDLASRSAISLDETNESDLLTPTRANFDAAQTSKRKPRPKSATYRVDMAPSPSQDSTTSSSTSKSSASSVTKTDSQDSLPISSPSLSSPQQSTRPAIFRLQPFLPPSLEVQRQQETTKATASRLLGRLRSLFVEDGKKWSCVWTTQGHSDKKAQDDETERILMYFEEDRPSLLPSPTKGTLTLSTELVDESGYEPSFWIAVAMSWIECQGERDGWREGRGGD